MRWYALRKVGPQRHLLGTSEPSRRDGFAARFLSVSVSTSPVCDCSLTGGQTGTDLEESGSVWDIHAWISHWQLVFSTSSESW